MYFGVWRKHPGAEIFECSFDETTGIIGVYQIPLNFAELNLEKGNSSAQKYPMYKLLNSSPAMLACVSITANVYMQVYDTFLEFQELDTRLVTVHPYASIKKHRYIPVGYIQTYQKCVAIYQYPYYLLMDVETGEIDGFPGIRLPMVDRAFPISIFRELADSDYDAIWQDTYKNTHLLRKGEIA